MPIIVTAKNELIVGESLVVEAEAPQGFFAAVFEDDGNTGYFYALDMSSDDNPIQDALHIYNVAHVADKEKTSLVKIGWSQDSQKAALLINNYVHAVFDFETKRSYCRTGFPSASKDTKWGIHGHEWNDDALKLFA